MTRLRSEVEAQQSTLRKSVALEDGGEGSTKTSETDDMWMMVDKQSSDAHSDPLPESPTRFSDVRDSLQLGKSRRDSSSARHRSQANESLLVDLPISSDDSLGLGFGPGLSSRAINTANPRSNTARTYALALDEFDEFPARKNSTDSVHPMLWLSDDVAALVKSSQALDAASRRDGSNITNPFKTTKQAYSERQKLKSASSSTIGLAQGSKARQPLKSASSNIISTTTSNADADARGQRRISDLLDLTDANGRPKKGVVGGSKVRRLAY